MPKIVDVHLVAEGMITAFLLAGVIAFALHRHKLGILSHSIICSLLIPALNSLGWELSFLIDAAKFRFEGDLIPWAIFMFVGGSIFGIIPSIFGYLLVTFISKKS